MLNEADIRAKLIDPKLHQYGWTEDKILRERNITPGKKNVKHYFLLPV